MPTLCSYHSLSVAINNSDKNIIITIGVEFNNRSCKLALTAARCFTASYSISSLAFHVFSSSSVWGVLVVALPGYILAVFSLRRRKQLWVVTSNTHACTQSFKRKQEGWLPDFKIIYFIERRQTNGLDIDLLTLHCPIPKYGKGSKTVRGAPVAQWVKRWPTDLAVPSSIPARGEIFSTVNGVPLHTAFHYHPSIVLI